MLYLKLIEKYKQYSIFKNLSFLLTWDQRVLLRKGSTKARATEISFLSESISNIFSDPSLEGSIKSLEDKFDTLSNEEKRNVEIFKNLYLHNNAVPKDLVIKFTKASVVSAQKWKEAKANNDYKNYEPYLEEVIGLKREIAKHKAEKLGCSLYEVLMDEYQPGIKMDFVDSVFEKLKTEIPKLTNDIKEYQKNWDIKEPEGNYPVEKQEKITREIMELYGYDFDRGFLSKTEHPFSMRNSDDARIATKYWANPLKAVMAVTHETGHALYNQGLPEKYRYQPIGQPVGMCIHESQSIFYEKMIGKNKNIIPHISKILAKYFDDESFLSDNLYKVYRKVENTPIRIFADEVTYPLHIILRYELEKQIISGELKVADIPDAWKAKAKEILKVDVKNDSEGCLQDIQWAKGAFGYFPDYLVGNIISSQFYKKMIEDKPSVVEDLTKGNIENVLKWLRDNIHSKGSLYNFRDLVKNVTSSDITPDVFLDFLKDKYLYE